MKSLPERCLFYLIFSGQYEIPKIFGTSSSTSSSTNDDDNKIKFPDFCSKKLSFRIKSHGFKGKLNPFDIRRYPKKKGQI
ncbi:hypothetical protein DERP_010616 [Dermatophagoides pteronyssinus]|uniref:Uncharacterized protein n=1 Tax=Dermatophagoides pteronyssinus TaxID=6956 RepID=A0ABQ8JA11_DERPT|nr:hypothetical protein DERP_010616 [Dermatophagoides pteronyssinus]